MSEAAQKEGTFCFVASCGAESHSNLCGGEVLGTLPSLMRFSVLLPRRSIHSTAAAELSPEHALLPAALSVVANTDVAIGTVLFHISFVRRLCIGPDLQHCVCCVGLLLGYPFHAVLAFFFL